jgi:hypothetical protein
LRCRKIWIEAENGLEAEAAVSTSRSKCPTTCLRSLQSVDLHWFFSIRTSYFFLSLNVLISYPFWASKCS